MLDATMEARFISALDDRQVNSQVITMSLTDKPVTVTVKCQGKRLRKFEAKQAKRNR